MLLFEYRSLSTEAMFTLGARALVPGHRYKMVLCSDTRYPRYKHPLQCPSTRSRPVYSGTDTVREFWGGSSCSDLVLGHQV